jgi:hypothetical protein
LERPDGDDSAVGSEASDFVGHFGGTSPKPRRAKAGRAERPLEISAKRQYFSAARILLDKTLEAWTIDEIIDKFLAGKESENLATHRLDQSLRLRALETALNDDV